MNLTADLETTTDENDCRVWAYAFSDIDNPEWFQYGTDLDELFEICKKGNPNVYFHNLRFDGTFLLIWLFEHGFKHVKERKNLSDKSFTTLISDAGLFYSIHVVFWKKGKKVSCVTFLDSFKIIPFKVEKVAKAFGLPLSKLEIDYKEKREKGHKLTPLEIEYIKHDVKIMAMALHTLFYQNLTKMTQGSNALFDYKNTVGKEQFEAWFPVPDYDKDIRYSYKGGFTYLSPTWRDRDIGEGIVLDVNSLYPWVMRYMKLPYGNGIYFQGKYEEDPVYDLYTQRIRCNFELKKDHIPTIQIKNNISSFIPTEYLRSSNGEDVVLTLTSVDLKLFFDHYNVYNLEYIAGWKFKSCTGLFSEYIDKWYKIKTESKIKKNAGMYTLAKLMMNALYGKFALNPIVRSKIPYLEDGRIKYKTGEEERRNPIYIPVGTFITAWARYKTISSAQKVYDRFMYADTDSLHLIGTEIPKELEISDTKLGAFKHEGTFQRARYLRQKGYIEEFDGELKVTCAGMPDPCKANVTWDNFHYGEKFAGKLQFTNVRGGVILKDIDFTLK